MIHAMIYLMNALSISTIPKLSGTENKYSFIKIFVAILNIGIFQISYIGISMYLIYIKFNITFMFLILNCR